jgi:uncharacterized iron-regulated membrane protein
MDKVLPEGRSLPLDALVQAAHGVAPSLAVRSVLVPRQDDASVQVLLAPADAHAGPAGYGAPAATATPGRRSGSGTIVYVNPYTAEVLGSHGEQQRFREWARSLHSSLLQGEGWRWMIELAASWLMVMLLTGAYLWWPRAGGRLPAEGAARGRGGWKHWHALGGVTLSVMSLAILVTGLSWSRHAGDQIRALRDAIGQAPPAPPPGLQSVPLPGQELLSFEEVLQAGRQVASGAPIRISAPRGAHGVWRLGTPERTQPGRKFTLVLDAYSGRTLYHAGWAQQTLYGKASAVGIPFHRGEFGWWNQVLLFVFGTGILFSLGSGWVMFLRRRREGFLGLPRLLPGAWTSVPLPVWAAGLALCVAMPLLALSAAGVAAIELVLARRRAASMVLARG